MQFSIPHKESKIAAMTRVKKALQQSREQLASHVSDMTESWSDNVLTFGFTVQKNNITGTVTVTDHTYDIYAKLPFVWRLFEGRIEKAIKEQVSQLLP
jgi:hypothetical protein